MREIKKQLLSIVLVVCLVIPLALDFIPAKAIEGTEKTAETAGTAETTDKTDAFGIRTDQEFNEDEAIKGNPYGTEGWVPIRTVSELFVAKGDSNNRAWNTYNYNEDGKVGSIKAVTSGNVVGKRNEGNKDGFSIVHSVPCDFKGEGQKRYTATIGYWKDKKYAQLFITDQNGTRVSQTVQLGSKDTLAFLNGAETHNNTGFLSVAAGDFDGDGRDSVLVYVPEMEKEGKYPGIWEYTVDESGQIAYKGEFCKVYSLLGVKDASRDNKDDGKVRKNAPVVQLLTADTDNDNVDELIITAGMNNCSANDVKRRHSQMFIYDYVNQGQDDSGAAKYAWKQSFRLETSGYTGGYNNAKRLRWASSDVGNLIVSITGTDYPEIITAGWIDKHGSDGDNMTDAIGSYVTRCMGATKTEYGTTVGSYEAGINQALSGNAVSEFTQGGHKEGDDVHSLLPVTIFEADGAGKKASVLISDTVYVPNESGATLDKVYRDSYFNDNDNGIGSCVISNNIVQDAVSGNFDGNVEGREQAVFTTCQKRDGRNDYFFKIYTYQKNGSGNWSCSSTDYVIKQIGNAYVSLCPLDIDNDSTIARVKEASLTYTEPEVLALLEASPYFKEVDGGDTGNSETAYGKSEGSGTSVTTSNGLSTEIITGFEYQVDDLTAGFANGAGFEATVENSFTWETSESTAIEYELNYSNDTGENMVLVYRRPVTVWRYEVKNSNADLVLAKEGTLLTSMISVEEYNRVAGQYGLSEIVEGVTLSEPGNPFSYRNSTAGLTDAITSTQSASYNGGGTISQGFTYSQEQESAFSYEMSASFSAYGIVFGTKFGGGAGYVTSSGNSTINMSSISKSGAVTGKKVDGYDFTWRFAHWKTKLDDTEIPVLGYVLTNVTAPPTPPTDVRADHITSTTAELSWEFGDRNPEEYRIYQIYPDGSKIQIGVVDGTENQFGLVKLIPNTSYTYAVSAYSEFGENRGESVMSEEVTVTTLPEGLASVEITSPKDCSVKPGTDAVFKSNIAVVSDTYQATNFQWQKKVAGGSWEDISGAKSSTLWVTDVKMEDNGSQYRCLFKVGYAGSASLIHYYSDAAKLHVGEIGVNVELAVTGHDNTGVGTLADPYKGKSDYQKQNGTTTTTQMVTEEVVIPADTEAGRPELTVYQYEVTTDTGEVTRTDYYGVGLDEKGKRIYYQLTKNGDAYIVGEEVTETETVIWKDDTDQAVTGLPDNLNGDEQISNTKEGSSKMYYLMAKATGQTRDLISGVPDAVDTRLQSATAITYYWRNGSKYYAYGENGSVGAEVTLTSDETSEFYDTYYKDDSTVILGRGETWTTEDTTESTEDNKVYTEESDYLYTKLDKNAVSYTVTLMQVSRETVYMAGETALMNFNSGGLVAVTEKKEETIEVPIWQTARGTFLTLTATVKDAADGTAAKGAVVDFYITNTETGTVQNLTGTVGNDGKASISWCASTRALYKMQGVVRQSGGYQRSETTTKYYDAAGTYAEETTEYRLVILKNGEDTAGTVSYGDIISLVLQERTLDAADTEKEWKNSDNTAFVFTKRASDGKETVLKDSTWKTEAGGKYIFAAYRKPETADGSSDITVEQLIPSDKVATATLEVKKVSVSISPVWQVNTIPENKSDVTLVANLENEDLTSERLKEVFDINCEYFDLQDRDAASGRYMVTLSYKDSGEKVNTFRNNFSATLLSDSFIKKPGSAKIRFTCGENGTLTGQYSDNNYPMESGVSKTAGTRLTFLARAKDGYAVGAWTINGTKYQPGQDNLPEGMELNDSGTQLRIERFNTDKHVQTVGGEKSLQIDVEFISVSKTITYSAGANGSITAVNAAGHALESGAKVNNGSSVTFTAKPENGYIIDHWTVNQKTWCWDGTDETYRETTLTLKDIREAKTVAVAFRKQTGNYTVSADVGAENGEADASLGRITTVYAGTENSVDLSKKLPEGTSLTFTALVTESSNNMVKEWRISTDGGNTYETIAGSGGQESVTLYNISEDTRVRAIVATAQKYRLNYEVRLNGVEVTDTAIAELTAESNGRKITDDEMVSAYIPVNFVLTLGENYYVKAWSDEVSADADDVTKASLASLTQNMTVTVDIAGKPIVTYEKPENGTIRVTDATDTAKVVASGDFVEPGTDIFMTFIPDKGFEMDELKVNGEVVAAVYTDANGETTDTKCYELAEITADQTIEVTYKAIAQHAVDYSVIYTSAKPNGTLTASADRKGMDAYSIESLTAGDSVYEGSEVTFTAKPDENYRVKEWIVNGVVQKQSGVTFTENTLSISDVQETTNVTVQFVPRGNKMTIQAGEYGRITSAKVGSIEQLPNIENGFTLGEYASVVITAEADTGYEVEKWTVNDETVKDGDNIYTGTTYTYDGNAGSTGADVKVFFHQIEYPVTWSGLGGAVKANDYDGNGAQIRGGTEVTFTAKPDAGMILEYWTVNGEKATEESGTILDDTFVWTVPNGKASSPEISTFKIQAIFTEAPYQVTYEQPEEHGTLSAKAGAVSLPSGSEVKGNTVVTFTVAPEDGWMVGNWIVNGETIDSQENAHKVTITSETKVSVTMIPDMYTVTVKKTGKGAVTMDGKSEESYQVPYGGNLTFTAAAEDYWTVKEWKANDVVVTEGVSKDRTEFTATDIRTDMTVEAVFAAALQFELSYAVEGNTGGSLSATADGEAVILESGQTTTVAGGSRLVFTAEPQNNQMVKAWTVNGETVADNCSNVLVIDEMTENTTVYVSYTAYKGYVIPVDGAGYQITDVERTPSDTTPENEIRENGTLTFRVALDEENGYNAMSSLTVNGYDCIAGRLADESAGGPQGCEEVTVTKNKDNSYTITVRKVTGEIAVTVEAHELEKVEAKKATCIEEGNIEYWQCRKEDCKELFGDAEGRKPLTEGDVILEKDMQNGHIYGDPVFTWEGTGSATAAFTCENGCGDVKKISCSVDKKQKGDEITYTATAKFDGKVWTDTKKETIPHSYANPVFTWKGTKSATAMFTCKNGCGNVKKLSCSVTSKTGKDTITYTAKVQFNGKTYTNVKTQDLPMKNVDFRLKGRTGTKKIILTWSRVPGASGYEIYRGKCSGKCVKVKTVKSNTVQKWTDTKKKANTDYKYYVLAYKLVDGKKQYCNRSNTIHLAVPTKNTNVKAVRTTSKLSLKKGKQKKLSVKLVYENKRKKLSYHMEGVTFKTTNKKIATVTKNGVIKAKGKGTCYVYVTAYSGAYVKVKVTVK